MATSSSSNKMTSSRIVPLNLHSSMTSSWPRLSISSRSRSPNRSKPASPRKQNGRNKKTCMCSPTTHPGSFRCNLHKNEYHNSSRSMSSNRLNARRSAMTNSLVRMITTEGGDLVRRALAALIRPSSHHQRRRSAFEPRPSRLSLMSKADHEL